MSADKLAEERELFGSSSSSDEGGEEGGLESDAVDGCFELLRGSSLPRGLSLHRGALDRETAKTLFEVLSKVLEEQEDGGEEREKHDKNRGGRQAFYFGSSSLPRWALALSARTLSTLVQSRGRGCWPSELAEREPLFDMAAVNSYGFCCSGEGKEGGAQEEGEDGGGGAAACGGLKQHVDLPRFADGVAIYSLGADAVMRFEQVAGAEKGGEQGGGVVSCRLRDGDLLLLSGEARWLWTHGFSSGDHFFRGQRIDRSAGLRIGVTLRKTREEGGGGGAMNE